MKSTYCLSLVYLGAGLVQAAPMQERNALSIEQNSAEASFDAALHPVEVRDPRFM